MHRIASFFVVVSFAAAGTDPFPRNDNIDVLHYTFRLELNDTTDIIVGNCDVTLRFTKPANSFRLNLTDQENDGKGMRVFGIRQSGKPVWFKHDGDNIEVQLMEGRAAGDTATFSISYSGIPIDGLIIGKNKFGDRTFFGDNWPDRGRHWLPVVDHPYDKAKVDFIITAPDHYKVIATGALVGERERPQKRKETHWREHTDVAMKVITIGVARFSVEQSGVVNGVPVTTWVFPQNAQQGFNDFSVAPQVLSFMQDYVGPYPYEKLAHVQSKTRFGGLENVSNIFYFENSVNGKNEREGLIAHETAHQWFGNSVTENDWHHVWLSEGFATYFDALYMGQRYGEGRLRSEMALNREQVIEFSRDHKSVIIDTTITDISKVLSTSTYQKASWVLHMLRARIGAENFQKGIRAYYAKFRDSNVMTSDFVDVMEDAADQDLDPFFQAWLYQDKHPRISGTWSFDKKSGRVGIHLSHAGFSLPPGSWIDVEVVSSSGARTRIKYPLQPAEGAKTITVSSKPAKVLLDPDGILLFEGEMKEKP